MKRKKYSLKKTWELCLAMWKWIAEEWQQSYQDTVKLKEEWLKQNGFRETYIYNDCFFCHYMLAHSRKKFRSIDDCDGCPGAEVAPRFNCYNSGWDTNPVKFYRILKRMYAKWKKLH